ncbi:MAG: hypothetical protein ACWGNI_10390, partial [Desulfobacterales bacterium]
MISSTVLIHPTTWFLMGAVLLVVLNRREKLKKTVLIGIPLIAFTLIHWLPDSFGQVSYLGFDLVFGRVDQLTRVFLHVFTIMA